MVWVLNICLTDDTDLHRLSSVSICEISEKKLNSELSVQADTIIIETEYGEKPVDS